VPIVRVASLLRAAVRHDLLGPSSTVGSAAAVPDNLNVLDIRELFGQHPERVQPTTLDDE